MLELRGVNNDVTSFNTGNATIRYNSASTQNMFTSGFPIYNLELTGGGLKKLRAYVQVNNILFFNGAIIELGAFDLITYSTTSINGTFSATNHARTNGNRGLRGEHVQYTAVCEKYSCWINHSVYASIR